MKAGAATTVRHQEKKLADDLVVVRMAALAGRTTEARAKLQVLLATDADNEEIADWLALVLFTDPAWLDDFILTVPEDRRIAIARLTIFKVGALHSDAAWELVRRSPYARLAARSGVKVEHREGMDILGYCVDSPLAVDTMLTPEFGFSEKEMRTILWSARGEENSRRILNEWMQGRWKGDPPRYVREAWNHFWHADKDTLREIEKTLPAELRGFADQFNALNEQRKNAPVTAAIPGVEQLSSLGPGELREVFETQRNSGTHIPLETFVQLPPKLRALGLQNYYQQSDGFHPELARESVAQLDHLALTGTEKRWILEGAAMGVWYEQGDYLTSLKWAARIEDEKGRAEFEEKLLTQLAETDPDSALEYTATLPLGGLRDKIERLAKEARP